MSQYWYKQWTSRQLGEEEANLCRRSWKILRKYSFFEEVKRSSRLLTCGLCRVVSFQRGPRGDEGTSARLCKWASTVINYTDSMYPWHDVMRTVRYLCGLPPPKSIDPVQPREKKYQTNLNGGTFYKETDQYSSKLSMSSKTKKAWDCHSQEQTKATWQINIMQYLGWDLETEKRHLKKTKKIRIKHKL